MIPPQVASFFGKGFVKVAIVGAVIVGVGLAVWMHYSQIAAKDDTIKAQAKTIAIHQHNEAVFRSVIASKQHEVEELEAQAKAVAEARREAQAAIATARLRLSTLREKYAKHDVLKLANAHPGMVVLRMDTATRQFFHDFEKLANQP